MTSPATNISNLTPVVPMIFPAQSDITRQKSLSFQRYLSDPVPPRPPYFPTTYVPPSILSVFNPLPPTPLVQVSSSIEGNKENETIWTPCASSNICHTCHHAKADPKYLKYKKNSKTAHVCPTDEKHSFKACPASKINIDKASKLHARELSELKKKEVAEQKAQEQMKLKEERNKKEKETKLETESWEKFKESEGVERDLQKAMGPKAFSEMYGTVRKYINDRELIEVKKEKKKET